jgi:glycine/D-amino acid oxidase-like deaminating enzyme
MAIRLPPLPDMAERLVLEGGRINPVWYQYLRGLEKRLQEAGITTFLENFHSSQLQDGATLRWDSGTQRWEISL